MPRTALAGRSLSACFLAPLLPLMLVASGARADRLDGRPAVATSTLTATPEEVHAALLQALSTWRIQRQSLEDGVVKTAWERRERGDELFRGRIRAEFRADGYQTRLSVSHERQRRSDELRTVVTAPAAGWRDVDGDHDVARAVVASVEQALGQEPADQPLDSLRTERRGPAIVRQARDRVVSPEVAIRINELKDQRRELVREIRAMDARILAAVYDDRYEEIAEEIQQLRARKTTMEQQVMAIDREILALVLAD